MDQGTLVLGGISVFGLVIGCGWIVVLRVRAGSWERALRLHPTQANLAVGFAWVLGGFGLITLANPQGAARTVLIVTSLALLLASLVAEAWQRTHPAGDASSPRRRSRGGSVESSSHKR